MNEQIFNIKLVEEIEKRPVLYNYLLTGYSRKDVTEKAWSEVAKEVDMSESKCKERWKNLRAVFVRRMKSGHKLKTKKPYYLTEAMKFALPFVKVLSKSTGYIPTPPHEEEKELFDDADTNEESSSSIQPSKTSPIPPPPPQTPPPLSPEQNEKSSENHTQPSINPIKRRIVQNESIDTNTFMEYFQTKKAKFANSSENKIRNDALRMFLLSLLPDLQSMNDKQVRQFKRKCLQNIDEILSATPYPSSSSKSTNVVISQSPSYSDHSSIGPSTDYYDMVHQSFSENCESYYGKQENPTK